jgi:diguanylate cyclase (GGDEF)-like protein
MRRTGRLAHCSALQGRYGHSALKPAAPLALLLVSADEADRRLFADLLGEAADVRWERTLSAGLDALDERPHDVVVIAAELDGGDGVRRLLDEHARAPVIELGEESGLPEIGEARARGAVDHLPRRGLDREVLLRALHHAVEHRRAVERLEHDALHDPLTGLPNRTLFLDRLAWSLRRARRRGGGTRCAVLFLDLDRFKAVNDSLGHQAGDGLLKAVAERLSGAVRPGDTVARLGGDEFIVLLEDVPAPHEATAVAERIQISLADPIPIAGRELAVTTSIGIALAAADAQPEDLIRDADVAMYRAKAVGPGGQAVFDAGMHRQVRARLDLERALRRAIGEEALEVHFQPIFGTDSLAIAGFEALCRWTVEPEHFVAIAEESGLIVPLGRFVLREAAARAAEWGVPVSVNLSAGQLRDASLGELIASALQESGPPPELLRLEVTEAAMAEDPDGARTTLLDIRDRLGVGALLANFGAGASSLHFLHRFPGRGLKIDRALVVDMLTDPPSQQIVKVITGLAHTLGMEVVAEGVETAAHLDRLKLFGCEYAQGFHLSSPLTADEARDLLHGRRAGALA